MSTNVQLRGSAERLQKRRISQKVCQKYRIHKDGDVLRFYYFSDSGVLQGCKVKTKDKVFTYEGQVPGTLFGQHLFPATGKRVVITEGELDAASCQEGGQAKRH
jgi:twinkle protein